jgi:hypothetical protein
MNNIFVNYEIAQKLKNLKFNEKCLKWKSVIDSDHLEFKNWNQYNNALSKPTYEQVLEFLRTIYFINIKIEYLCSVNEILALVGVIDFMINKHGKPDIHIQSTFLDYYEVLTETILECLNIVEKWKM